MNAQYNLDAYRAAMRVNANFLAALQTIADGHAMLNVKEYSLADVIVRYQQIARAAIETV